MTAYWHIKQTLSMGKLAQHDIVTRHLVKGYLTAKKLFLSL